MKKVLIFRYKLLPYSETFIKTQAEALNGWEYMYLGSRSANELPLDSSKVILIPKIINNKFLKKYLGFIHQFIYNQFIKSLKRMRFDLLHAHFGTDAVSVAHIADSLNIPMLVTLHGVDITVRKEVWASGTMGKKHKNYPEMLLALANKKDVYFIAVSEAIKQNAIEFGIPPHKVTVSYIGINMDKFTPKGHGLLSKSVLFIGRMVEKKGAAILIKAFAEVIKKVPDAKLVMIGDGEELASNMQLASSLSLPIEFVGVKTTDEVVSFLNNSRVLCLPSITAKNGDAEGLPIVILEAQACGVPVVSSARGGATEGIVHGRTGFAFPEKDEEKLCNFLIQLLQDDALVEFMSVNALQHARQKFDISECTRMLEDTYDALSKKL